MKTCFSKLSLGIASALLLSSQFASAVTVDSFNGPVNLGVDGACDGSGVTRFDLPNGSLVTKASVSDNGAPPGAIIDTYDIYIVDSNNLILSAALDAVTTATLGVTTRNVQGAFNINAAPGGGPFRFVVVENTSPTVGGATLQNVGDTLNRPVLRSLSFDANALDSDCPGAGGQLTQGAISAATANKVLLQALSNGISLNGLLALTKHLDRITVGGFGRLTPKGSGTSNLAVENRLADSASFQSGLSQTEQSQFDELLGSLYRIDTTENNKTASTTGDVRQAIARLMPMFEFDTSDGITLPAFLQSKSKLNAAQDEVLNQQDTPPIGDLSDLPFSVWLDTNFTVVDNDFNQTGSDQRFDGDILTVTTGMDYWVNDQWLVGAYFSYSNAELDTTFNTGKYDENAFTISPYVLYKLSENVLINASFGYVFSNIDQSQNITTTPVTSSTDADTIFATIEAKYKYDVVGTPFQLIGSTGYKRSRRTVDSFTDSASTFNAKQSSNSSQFKLGGEARYNVFNDNYSFQPFAKLDLLYEFMDQINGDPLSANVTAGMRFFHPEMRINWAIEANALLGQDKYNQYGISGTISRGFETGLFGGGLLTPLASVGADSQVLNSKLGLVFENKYKDMRIGFETGLRAARYDDEEYRTADKYFDLNAIWKF